MKFNGFDYNEETKTLYIYCKEGELDYYTEINNISENEYQDALDNFDPTNCNWISF